jgi:4-hydroxybenzoate polyprenyltransferase
MQRSSQSIASLAAAPARDIDRLLRELGERCVPRRQLSRRRLLIGSVVSGLALLIMYTGIIL